MRNFSSLGKPNRLILGGCDKKTKLQIINKLAKEMSIGDIIVIPIIDVQTIKELKEELEDKNFKTNLNNCYLLGLATWGKPQPSLFLKTWKYS